MQLALLYYHKYLLKMQSGKKWGRRQNLVYQIFVLLHQRQNDFKGEEKFTKLVKWLQNKRTLKQCFLHHHKMTQDYQNQNKFLRYLMRKNYSLRMLPLKHIQRELQGNFGELIQEDQELLTGFLKKWGPQQNENYEIIQPPGGTQCENQTHREDIQPERKNEKAKRTSRKCGQSKKQKKDVRVQEERMQAEQVEEINQQFISSRLGTYHSDQSI